ncbi:uncharacterized protein PADG_03715 [Paracoccidioides brasiliensis Pb18]|uniref:peptidylprolyl isomerase n=1 Tax=Paracoccidioides brasiliensis (strain Pb18) TaxID=502780 RepID=C1G8X9_PARBD|nr:uncharacterized protein PADG_03715 [Paracoccidioides brasiliensis Pb18]EEH47631.1 hypothetical protein PADG_03715 [Paracoccidioides brasiliensis Pb18]
MSSTHPVALYAVKVPPGGILVPAAAGASAMFRVTMAAIDPDCEPEFDADTEGKPPRATLKIVRPPPGMDLDDDSDDSDYEGDSGDEDENKDSEDESNGGPSDPAKQKQARQLAAMKEMADAMDEDEDEDESDGDDIDLKAAISNLIKGKAKATGDDDENDTSEGLEMEEVVVCTLDPQKNCQQPLDFVVAEDEHIFFKVTGTHSVYITGNYVMPSHEPNGMEDSDESDEEHDMLQYDLSPDEDELVLMGEDDESDELDNMDDPRITEIDTDEEEAEKPAFKKDKKGKNKRPAEDSGDDGANLDDMMSKAGKPASEPITNGNTKLSKKQLKKLKKNNGEAVEIPVKTSEPTKSDKKVQFAKNLEQGPTPSPPKKEGDKKASTTGTLGVKEVQGVKLDDKKLGTGRVAKKGDRVSMRYIGKLESGKVFDANKKGPPFSFKLGSGEVIKGWDIGIPGMAVGGERRVTIPAHLAYGKKALPGIPANSKLIFDVKLLDIK